MANEVSDPSTLMHCREFRNKHVAFVDDLLPACEMDAMQRHLERCSGCARQDTRVRRSLLLIRNLPPIEPSADFVRRLNERLAAIQPEARPDAVIRSRVSFAALGSAAAVAAGIAAVAYLSLETMRYYAPPADLASTGTPVMASAPVPISNAALVASVSTGMPVWPVVLMAGQSPLQQLSSLQFTPTDNTP
jgi:anti-sigma factor RsiW